MSHGRGAILEDTYTKLYPADNIPALQANNTLVFRVLPNGKKMIVPKFTDLIAFYSIETITEEILPLSNDADKACELLIKLADATPFCDIVGCGVLLKIASPHHMDTFSQLVLKLLDSPPRFVEVSSGTRILIAIDDRRQIEFEVPEGAATTITNYLPFIILSQLASYPWAIFKSEHDTTPDYKSFLALLQKVGSYNDVLRRVDAVNYEKMKPYNGHQIENHGYVVSGSIGIIEPIIHALQFCFRQLPTEMDAFIQTAFADNNFMLLWRLFLGLRELTGATGSNESARAESFVQQFLVYFNKFMAEESTQEITDDKLREETMARLLGFHAADKLGIKE
jgi:hypothetical protein